MQDDAIYYAGQPVAVVVADSHERAQYAASLVDVSYESAPFVVAIEQARDLAYEAERLFGGLLPGRSERGDVESALAGAEARIDVAYRMAANHHNPIEPPSTTAVWEDGRLTLYDSTMSLRAVQLTVAQLLGLALSDVRVIAHYVGGGFGSKAMVWPHVTLTAMAARHVGRPVKLMLTRPQMFTATGHREEQEHQLSLAATRDGQLTAIRHSKLSITSCFDDWAEPATGASSQLYACPNFLGTHRLIRGNTMTPTFMRGPGETLGVFALETAMDELACAVGADPVALRIRNHTDLDPHGTAIFRTPPRPSGRWARRWSARPSTRPGPRCASGSWRWRSPTNDRRCTEPTRGPWRSPAGAWRAATAPRPRTRTESC